MQKNSVFRTFCATFRKKCVKTMFFHVLQDSLYNVRNKNAKNTVFKLLARHSAKSVRKPCFSTSFETLCTFFAENANISVLWSSCATLSKMWEKTLFFHVFRGTIHKVRKSCENSVFWAFCARFREKCEKTMFFFSSFSRHFVQISLEMLNNSVFQAFYATILKMCEKKVFFHVFIMLFYHVVSVFFHVFQ